MNAADQDEWLTVGEVATKLRLSKMSVYRLVHSGVLESARIGRRAIRIPKASYEAYVAAALLEPITPLTVHATPA
ncbi:helix-turn-helix domain-containing protein [Microbispora sp. NPDC049125]|uniref:helix-turn-helix domain-containing protein n=1 Tax=Microbispora sp. NPDC049125 TaxID=3154929 RepID=UPI003466BDA0